MNWRYFINLWSKIAIMSFGGPAGQIAVMHQKVVDEEKLVSEEEFLSALNFCMLLPGPEAQQLATYLGWKLRGIKGGLVAGLLFILPGFLTILLLSTLYVRGENSLVVTGVFYGLRTAVVALVVQAIISMSKKTLRAQIHWFLAVFSFLMLLVFNLPFPIILLIAFSLGYFTGPHSKAESLSLPPIQRSLKTSLFWLAVWLLPLLALGLGLGPEHILTQIAIFFSKLSLMSFGGAYAALSYMAQQLVEVYHWITPTEMLDALSTAETTPGPLILVVQFVGFITAANSGVEWPWFVSAFLGSLTAVWMTFAPCFLWIFTFAPYIEALRKALRWQNGLKAISSSVVGVITHLSFWFTSETILTTAGFDPIATALIALGLILLFIFKQRWWMILSINSVLGIFAMYF